ncbi:MAG: hypothetical protein J6B70_01210 [Oscillospiraceae bacterium]|nr:hypothetical protein [Oscillospiraceae bacterium]
MNEQLFRKKSIERVSSPEQLDAYIRVANPGVWLVLIAIIVLLVGVCVWGILGHLDTTISAVAVCENGTMTLYVKDEDGKSARTGMEVRIGEDTASVTAISLMPIKAETELSDYIRHVGGFGAEDWVYALQTDAQLPDGVYSAKIIVESVSPMSFVVN